MFVLYADAFFLLFTWYVGILYHGGGVFIHILPMLAFAAVIMRFNTHPTRVNIVVNTSSEKHRIRT